MPESDGRLRVSWSELEELIAQLADQVRGEYDVLMAVTRGGLVPAGMLAYRLGMRNILVAAVAFYDEGEKTRPAPEFLEFPEPQLLAGRRVLILDEVWDSGSTITAVAERVRRAGGHPTTAVLHYKPGRSKVGSGPDHFVVATDAWVVYPFKGGG